MVGQRGAAAEQLVQVGEAARPLGACPVDEHEPQHALLRRHRRITPATATTTTTAAAASCAAAAAARDGLVCAGDERGHPLRRAPRGGHAWARRLQPLLHTAQPRLHTITASVTYGYSLCHMRLQPLSRTVTASVTYGYSLCYVQLQPL